MEQPTPTSAGLLGTLLGGYGVNPKTLAVAHLAGTKTLRPFATLTDGAFFIDNSTYEWIQLCETGAKYRIIDGRQSKGISSALHFGGAVHCGLEARYKSEFINYEAQLKATLEALFVNPTEVGDWRTSELAIDVIQAYNRTYPVETFDVINVAGLDSLAVPAVELPFAVPLGVITIAFDTMLTNLRPDGSVELLSCSAGTQIPVVWTGKIDLLINWQQQTWLCDHKTTSVFGPSYFEQFRLSGQFTGYAWAVKQALGINVHGVMVNVIAIRKPTKTGKGVEFSRQWLPIDAHRIDDWQRNTMMLIQNFFYGMSVGDVPMRTCSCRTRWQRNCEYIEVCTLPKDHRGMYLESGDFKTVDWSPLDE